MNKKETCLHAMHPALVLPGPRANDIPAGVLSALPTAHQADIALSRNPGRKK